MFIFRGLAVVKVGLSNEDKWVPLTSMNNEAIDLGEIHVIIQLNEPV